jgi:hypothetical protein
LSVFRALFLPRVPFYVIGYAGLKGCIYGFLFWLPSYLKEVGLGDQRGYIASMIDIGSFVGALILGYLVDRFPYRALFISPMLLFSTFLMLIVSITFTNIAWEYYTILFFIGICIGGPYCTIGTAITIDLGQQIGG